MAELKKEGRWWWPKWDSHTCKITPEEAKRIPEYLELVPRRGLVVQAGGNAGVFPQVLAEHFRKVITFEPDPDNFACMERNITASNVEMYNKALGDRPTFGEVYREKENEHNSGGTMVREGMDVPVLPLDHIPLDGLDFLFLDVEGWEGPAVRGAEAHIERFRPVISLEMKGIGDKLGWPEQETIEWLAARGYRIAEGIGRDKIFVPC